MRYFLRWIKNTDLKTAVAFINCAVVSTNIRNLGTSNPHKKTSHLTMQATGFKAIISIIFLMWQFIAEIAVHPSACHRAQKRNDNDRCSRTNLRKKWAWTRTRHCPA
jgi:hypothetical protein